MDRPSGLKARARTLFYFEVTRGFIYYQNIKIAIY